MLAAIGRDCVGALQCLPDGTAPNIKVTVGPEWSIFFEFLKASDEPARDQMIFLQAQIMFWLLAATDGHAKNFSVFLRSGGGSELAPLYDREQIQRADLKLAMSVGDNWHYHLHEIQPRHFEQTVRGTGSLKEIVDRALNRREIIVAVPH